MYRLIAGLFFLVSLPIQANIGSPLTKDSNTIALWNFDGDTITSVVDSADNPISATATNTTLEAVPGIDATYSVGRLFGSADSGIAFGRIANTKLDFAEDTALSIEAVIRLNIQATNSHVIFNNEQVLFLVVGNKLTGFVRQQSGLVGLGAETSLEVGTIYRVAYVVSDNRLGLFINGRNVGGLDISESIGASTNADAVGVIGGSFAGEYFPGHIDDVRISNSARVDNIVPAVEITSHSHLEVVEVKRPQVTATFSDSGSGIDTSTAEVFLNDVLQTGFSVTATGISGVLNQNLLSNSLNRIVVRVRDTVGNLSEEEMSVRYRALGGRREYVSDKDTLLLLHMNDHEPLRMEDSSSSGAHGRAVEPRVAEGEGVFGFGKHFFSGVSSMRFELPFVSIPGQAFTFETWLRPSGHQGMGLFNSSQLEVRREGIGYIRIILKTRVGNHTFQTHLPEFLNGNLHHLAVTWQGGIDENNLIVYKDGIIVQAFDAPFYCDFNLGHAPIRIGEGYNGLLDEMRLSSVVRSSFNYVPQPQQRGILFNSPTNRGSTNEVRPSVDIDYNFDNSVSASDVQIFLNGVDQSSSNTLSITGSSITGKMKDSLIPGLNELDVVLTDSMNNQRRKSIVFFYIENLGGHRNISTNDTAVLLNFEGDHIFDKSSNNIRTFSQTGRTGGVIGQALDGAIETSGFDVSLRGKRSLTIEFMIKKSAARSRVVTLISSERHQQMTFDFNESGNINFSWNKERQSIHRQFERVYPDDGNWHHVAVVIDASRIHNNFLVVIDGELKHIEHLDCYCDLHRNYKLRVGGTRGYENVDIDEFVITAAAKYSFNYEKGSKPILRTHTGLPAGGSITTLNPTVSYIFNDVDGIHERNTYLSVNGTRQTNLMFRQSGNDSVLSGEVGSLTYGLNDIEVFFEDLKRNAQSRYYQTAIIRELTPAAYTADANTLALYHMDETAGTQVTDVTDNGNHITDIKGATLGNDGVFDKSLTFDGTYNQQNPASVNISGFNGLKEYTIEFWFKPVPHGGMHRYRLFSWQSSRLIAEIQEGGTDVILYFTNRFHHRFNLGTFYQAGDTDWKHVAMVVKNIQKTIQNDAVSVGLLVNGRLVGYVFSDANNFSPGSDSFELPRHEGGFGFPHGIPHGTRMDELRISDIARYSSGLVVSLPTSLAVEKRDSSPDDIRGFFNGFYKK